MSGIVGDDINSFAKYFGSTHLRDTYVVHEYDIRYEFDRESISNLMKSAKVCNATSQKRCDPMEISDTKRSTMEAVAGEPEGRTLAYLSVIYPDTVSCNIDIVGAYFEDNLMVIILLDSAPNKTGTIEEVRDRLRRAAVAIRSFDMNVTIIDMNRGCLISDDDIETYAGCMKNGPYHVVRMQNKFHAMLCDGTVRFDENLVSITSDSDEVVNKFIECLSSYNYVMSEQRSIYIQSFLTDCLVETVMMIPYFREIAFIDE